jgi:hypothetical protein
MMLLLIFVIFSVAEAARALNVMDSHIMKSNKIKAMNALGGTFPINPSYAILELFDNVQCNQNPYSFSVLLDTCLTDGIQSEKIICCKDTFLHIILFFILLNCFLFISTASGGVQRQLFLDVSCVIPQEVPVNYPIGSCSDGAIAQICSTTNPTDFGDGGYFSST